MLEIYSTIAEEGNKHGEESREQVLWGGVEESGGV